MSAAAIIWCRRARAIRGLKVVTMKPRYISLLSRSGGYRSKAAHLGLLGSANRDAVAAGAAPAGVRRTMHTRASLLVAGTARSVYAL